MRRKNIFCVLFPVCLVVIGLLPLLVNIIKFASNNGGVQNIVGDDEESSLYIMDVRRTSGSGEKQVIIWEMQDGRIVPTDKIHYSSLESDKAYIILQGNTKVTGQYWQIYNLIGKNSSELIFTLLRNSEPIRMDVTEFNSFTFGKNHFQIEDKLLMLPERWTIHYWIGGNSSCTIAGDAAYYAVILHALLHPKVNIRREPEGHESDAFKAVFGRGEGQRKALEKFQRNALMRLSIRGKHLKRAIMKENSETKGSSNELGTKLDDNAKFMILIEGKDEVRFREVEPSVHYAEGEDNCVVLISVTVYIYCGKAASEAQKNVAQGVSRMMLKKKISYSKVTIQRHDQESPEEKQMLEKFFREFERIPEASERKALAKVEESTARASGKIFGQTVKSAGKEINIEIHENGHGVVLEQPFSEHTPISSLLTNNCYLVDTGEKEVGVLVWMGMKSEIGDRGEYARRAEEYLRRKKEDAEPTHVTFVDEENVYLPIGATVGDLVDNLEATLGTLASGSKNEIEAL